MMAQSDIDNIETQEWLDALDAVVTLDGPERAQFLLDQLHTRLSAQPALLVGNTPYINTIAPDDQAKHPGDIAMEQRIEALMRWNAVATVLRAGKKAPELGGHIASYASAATLYETGFNHFFRAPKGEFPGDMLFIQGHSSPGIYARAYLEGRLSEEQLDYFRQECQGKGVSSYPHPWLMPDFWQFPTVSMGLGPIQAIYQARFQKYMENRGLLKPSDRKIWMFCGDGEMDEPESMGCLSIAAREKLDNLIVVINCNLQRLDGPVRGNSKVIQEFESIFRGAGWNVIKIVWSSEWDSLLAEDDDGLLRQRMQDCVDGEYQNFSAKGGDYLREHFFGHSPELAAMVEDWSDEDLEKLQRGGHDPLKVYAAYAQAVATKGQPTVILAKTVKGYGMGEAGEAQNTTHQQKKMSADHLAVFCERFDIPVPKDKIAEVPFYKPAADSPELQYLNAQRESLHGHLPARHASNETLTVPELPAFHALLESSGEREISTTMAFVRFLAVILKDKNIKERVVPIVPDESRTFGMEGLFRQIGIYSPVGQLYEPVDKAQVMYYREKVDGQLLEEGINEAGAFASWMAAATSYSNCGSPMIPFYIYYSMFGFQRIADLAWAAGDIRARGFLLGATAGRTTLSGEGLQHTDGHSHIFSSVIPNCISYDPTYAYELAVILQDGMRRMFGENEDVFYYVTLMNENYTHPNMPAGVEDGIIKGMYLLREAEKNDQPSVNLLGSGTILREVLAAADMLATYHVAVNVWSVTSFNELRRDGLAVERENRLNPGAKKQSYVEQCLSAHSGPVIAATDYIRLFADQIRNFVPQDYHVLGTDGFGRSDTRVEMRAFFEVDARHIAYTALKALVDNEQMPAAVLDEAIAKLKINTKAPAPWTI